MPRRALLLLLFWAAVLATISCRPSVRFRLNPTDPKSDSVTFSWREHPEPVLDRQNAAEWESSDVLNPSVIRWRDRYWNLYSGFDGKTWHTGVAWSGDGLTWTRKQRILSPDSVTWEGSYIAANGSVAAMDGERLLYWYQAGREVPAVGVAESGDGLAWRRLSAQAVLEPGPNGSWDERGVADPYVIRQGEWLYLYYTGMDRAQRQRLGVARSRDGVRWEKSLDNPVLDLGGHDEWDEGGLGEPAVWESHGSYWMLYTGRAWNEVRRMGLARSSDGIHWTKNPGQLIAGGSPWDTAVVCDPSVEVTREGVIRVWFGGGDVPRPDERIHGAIGYGELTPVR